MREVSSTQVRVSGLAPAAGEGEMDTVEAVPGHFRWPRGLSSGLFGADDLSVPLPEIPEPLASKIAPVNGRADGLLTYSHFSICIRADRRLRSLLR